ncbi:MAG TPA: hypothetical protein VFA80_20060 [Xanthobacteraceae bacterium]|jgi:hypothetical protein|nr:hypothetical protein [Xanthobacteraceae bacterium]
MRLKPLAIATLAALCALTTVGAQAASPAPSPAASLTRQQIGALGKIVPGHSSKADIKALLGEPWRVVQFNDCGEAMDGQDDETWEYRGTDAAGGFRLHVEFNEHGTVHLFAKMPDKPPNGEGTKAAVEPGGSSMGMSM